MTTLKVQFVHGLESGPGGHKARYLAERFDALTPAMDTADWDASVAVQRAALAEFAPDVLVGSSFGGAVVVELLREGAWTGPTLLLAGAARKRDPAALLPAGVPVTLVHGLSDDVVPVEDSRALAASGDPACTRLLEVADGHRLGSLLEGERLAELVRAAADPGAGTP